MEIKQQATGKEGARKNGGGHCGKEQWNWRWGVPDSGVSMGERVCLGFWGWVGADPEALAQRGARYVPPWLAPGSFPPFLPWSRWFSSPVATVTYRMQNSKGHTDP